MPSQDSNLTFWERKKLFHLKLSKKKFMVLSGCLLLWVLLGDFLEMIPGKMDTRNLFIVIIADVILISRRTAPRNVNKRILIKPSVT